MKKFFALIFIVFCYDALAQNLRETSFAERSICEESKGTWREFGNECADKCRAQFDEYLICSEDSVYSCDCGKNRCWNGKTCVSLKDYKKVFDVKQAEEKAISEKEKEKRAGSYKANQIAIMNNVIRNKNISQAVKTSKSFADFSDDNSKPTINSGSNYDSLLNPPSQAKIEDKNQKNDSASGGIFDFFGSSSDKTNSNSKTVQSAPVTQLQGIPPFIQQQIDQKKKEEDGLPKVPLPQ